MSDKTLTDRIKQSTANRNAMIQRFGFVPLSILRMSRGELSRKIYAMQGESPQIAPDADEGLKAKRAALARAGYKAAKSSPSMRFCGREGHLGLSSMPPELVDFFIKYYAAPGQTYLDPFMGQGVRMQVAKLRGLHYYGYDLCEDFFNFISGVKRKIDDKKTKLEIFNADSKHPDNIPDNVGDFSFYSPPYWDIEWYGPNPEQLGTGKSYEQFLKGMQQVAEAWLPKFKRGAVMVVNINDFRKDGKFYSYHSDCINLYERAGWLMSDMWVIDGLVGGGPKTFAVSFNLKRIAPKVHEYALVFRKP